MRQSMGELAARLVACVFAALVMTNSTARAAPARDDSVRLSQPIFGEHTLFLAVHLNGSPTQVVSEFRRRQNGRLAILAADLETLGIRAEPTARDQDGLIDLDQLPGVDYRYDEAAQIVYLTATHDALMPNLYDIRRVGKTDLKPTAAGRGAVLNYIMFGTSDLYFADPIPFDIVNPALSTFLDGWLYSEWGVLAQSAIVSTTPDDLYDSVRLDTSWSYSDPETLITYQAGDLITGGLEWTRPIRIAGIQIRRNFGLRADLITMPMPALSGSAAVPSTLEVYTNNTQVFSQEVPPGPFEVSNIPVVTGAGTARVIVRDNLGRATTIDAPFYGSRSLLREGISDFSLEIGFPRRFYGVESADYDDMPAGSASIRYGWSDRLTLEGHSEGTESLFNAGAGAVFSLFDFALASLSATGSTSNMGEGMLVSAGLDIGPPNLFLRAYGERVIGDYADLAATSVDLNEPYPVFGWRAPRAIDQLSLSSHLPHRLGALTLSFSRIEDYTGFHETQVAGLSYSRQMFANANLYASAFQDLRDPERSGFYAGISFPLGRRHSGAVSVEKNQDNEIAGFDLKRSDTAEIGSFGWRIRDREGTTKDRFAFASYRARPAYIEGGIQQFEDSYGASLQAQGAVVAAGGGLFFTNPIYESFAVVDAGAPGVDVLYENRPVGRTNRKGKLLIPYLNAYQENTIAIDPASLPLDADFAETEERVVPRDRNGAVIAFEVQTEAPSALVSFQDTAGTPLAAGLSGRVTGTDNIFVVGYDGQAYIHDLQPQNHVTIALAEGAACQASFAFLPTSGTQTQIPGVVCR